MDPGNYIDASTHMTSQRSFLFQPSTCCQNGLLEIMQINPVLGNNVIFSFVVCAGGGYLRAGDVEKLITFRTYENGFWHPSERNMFNYTRRL